MPVQALTSLVGALVSYMVLGMVLGMCNAYRMLDASILFNDGNIELWFGPTV